MGRPQGRGAAGSFGQPQRPVQAQGPDRVSSGDELELLKKQSQDLRRHMDQIAERIAALEKKEK
jgi:hypothetical protein